jgi:hypothetical protein
MARKGDIKRPAAPITIGKVRRAVPVTVVYRASDGAITPVDYSDMTTEQMRGIASEFHVTAVICRTCGDEAPHCPDVSPFFSA